MILYKSGMKKKDALFLLRSEHDTPEVREICDFVERSERGLLSYV